MKQSYNDYWNGFTYLWKWILNLLRIKYINNRQINDATLHECGIIKVDVIYKKGEVLLSHSWRPRCLTYGRLEDYLIKLNDIKIKSTLYLYIEIKTSDEKITYKILDFILRKYKNINYIIGAKNKIYSRKREKIANELLDRLGKYVMIYHIEDFKKNIDEIHKLYKYKKIRLNHF